tara:strand:+ start:118 stop:876 length:759 start_codon:yes stop_codon:yes gene_type:complete
MDSKVFKGKDGKEYFNLVAQSGAITTSNDPEDLIQIGGTKKFPFVYANTLSRKAELVYAEYIYSDNADDITEVSVIGIDGKMNFLQQTVKLNGTTPVKFLKPFVRINDIIPANNHAFTGSLIATFEAYGAVSKKTFCTLMAGEKSLRDAVYSPYQNLYIDKIQLISGAEDIICTVTINKVINNSSIGSTLANSEATRVPIKYIYFEKPSGQVADGIYEFKNPYCIRPGETLLVTVEEVTGTTVMRCNIEGHF